MPGELVAVLGDRFFTSFMVSARLLCRVPVSHKLLSHMLSMIKGTVSQIPVSDRAAIVAIAELDRLSNSIFRS